MKKLVCIVLLGFSMSACREDKEPIPARAVLDKIDTAAVVNQKGQFSGVGGESVTGNAKILERDGSYSLALENFRSDNGPDLRVYLSNDRLASNFVDLGALKATSGTQVYPIPAATDFARFNYAMIYCQKFGVVFGVARLE